MGTPVGDEPVRPDDCPPGFGQPCSLPIDNEPECRAIGGSIICPGDQTIDRGANINPRYCVYEFVSATFTWWIGPNDCRWDGLWTFSQCSDDPV